MKAFDYRQTARENLKDNWPFAICVAAVVYLLCGTTVCKSFIPEIKIIRETFALAIGSLRFENVEFGTSTAFLAMPQFIIGGVAELCYTLYLMRQYDHQSTTMEDIIPIFDRFLQGFLQAFFRGLFTILWSLLLIVPGVIASYSYRMTPYIMIDRPELTARQAIAASKEMMHGHKWELFCLDFSFIGWNILAALTLNLGHLVLNPYKNAARTAFYRNLKAQQ